MAWRSWRQNGRVAHRKSGGDRGEAGSAGSSIKAIKGSLMPCDSGGGQPGGANEGCGDSTRHGVSGCVWRGGGCLDKLREKAREMGRRPKFSASEATTMEYMAMAGENRDMLDAIEDYEPGCVPGGFGDHV